MSAAHAMKARTSWLVCLQNVDAHASRTKQDWRGLEANGVTYQSFWAANNDCGPVDLLIKRSRARGRGRIESTSRHAGSSA